MIVHDAYLRLEYYFFSYLSELVCFVQGTNIVNYDVINFELFL